MTKNTRILQSAFYCCDGRENDFLVGKANRGKSLHHPFKVEIISEIDETAEHILRILLTQSDIHKSGGRRNIRFLQSLVGLDL